MYQALYRKWRPRTFSEVVGQEHITATLQKQVAEGRVGHAYLFTGTRGTGKTTCARILAKAVNCESPVDGAPCCQCAACRAIEEGTALDVTELDAASNNGVDQVRALREEAIYTPSNLKKRVYIIDEVHMLSTPAFNALLKILEEPPAHLLFILATTELHKVLPTILSRCQRFTFKRILPRDMERQLLHIAQAEGIDLAPDGAELLSRMAGGALRDALSLLDQCRVIDGTIDSRAVLEVLGLAGGVQTLQLMRLIIARSTADALALFDQLYRSGKDVAALLAELLDLCRDAAMCRAAPEGGSALLTGLYDRAQLAQLAQGAPLTRFVYMAETIGACCAALPNSLRPRTDAELCLIKLCDETLCGDLTALCARLDKLEAAVESGVTVSAKAPSAAAPAPAAKRKTPPAAYNAPPLPEEEPPLPEEPPMPEEPGARAWDIPQPAERPAEKKKKAASAPAAGDSGIWKQLMERYKGRLAVSHRAFLPMASGLWDGETLTVVCPNDFVKSTLDTEAVREVLREVTAAAVGGAVRVVFSVGGAPAARPAGTAPSPRPETAPEPPPQAAPKAADDAWECLMNKGKNLSGFKIED